MKPTKCRIVCPDCGKPKMQFETEKAANLFIKYNGSELQDDVSKLRVYYCNSCCCYHITSKHHWKTQDVATDVLIDSYRSLFHIGIPRDNITRTIDEDRRRYKKEMGN